MYLQQVALVAALVQTDTTLGKLDEVILRLIQLEHFHVAAFINGARVEQELVGRDGKQRFCHLADAFLIDDLTDELKAEVVDMYKQVYAKAKYTVDTATEVDDSTFGVKVTVEPLDVFDRVAEALWGDTPDARAEALYSQDVDSMTDEEYAAYDAEWCRLVIDLTLEKLPEAEYLEAQSKVVQITLGDDNYWSLDEQDFSDLDWLILDYNF